MAILLFVASTGLAVHAQQREHTSRSATFVNPIFPGDYPDPSILVDGDDFYVVHSSFEYYPGLTIWHSKDLIHWKPVKNALTTYVGSVWAPELVKYEEEYFIYFPANRTNYVIHADSITGKWSDPIDLKVSRIDPGHLVDEQGNRYLYFSSGGYVPLSRDGLRVTGKFQFVYEGWDIPRDWTIECFCMESPKFFKRGKYYYLTVAQGGTAGPATGHMVISARSTSPVGPWENSPYNPIIRTESPNEKWCSVGHATVFEATPEQWWMIFHGYENGHYNLGRQTLLAPVEWTEEGWYKLPDSFDLEKKIRSPRIFSKQKGHEPNYTFDAPGPGFHWKFFGVYDKSRLTRNDHSIEFKSEGQTIADGAPLLFKPRHHSYRAEVEMEIKGNAMGGLVLYYNRNAFSGILADRNNILANIRGWQFITEKNVISRQVHLRLENLNNTVDLYFSTDGQEWTKIKNSLEVSGYHHNVLGGFLSLQIGLVSLGDGSVSFKNFNYSPIN